MSEEEKTTNVYGEGKVEVATPLDHVKFAIDLLSKTQPTRNDTIAMALLQKAAAKMEPRRLVKPEVARGLDK